MMMPSEDGNIMTLDKYLKRKKLTVKEFSANVGINLKMVYLYLGGERLPSLRNAYKIYKCTRGQVKLKDWFDG